MLQLISCYSSRVAAHYSQPCPVTNLQSRGYGGAAPAAPQLHLLWQPLCCSSCGSHNAAASALQLLLCCSVHCSCGLQHQHRLHGADASERSWFPSLVSHCVACVIFFRRGALCACAVRTTPRCSSWTRSSASVAGTEEQGPRLDQLTLAQHCLHSILGPLFIHHVNSWCRAPRGLGPPAAQGWALGVRVADVCGVFVLA